MNFDVSYNNLLFFRNLWNNLVIALSLVINIFMVATWDSKGALGKTELPTAGPAPEFAAIDR